MYKVSDEFLEALSGGAVHHIRGRLFDVTGAEIELDDNTIVGQPVIETQCVEDEEIFNIAELYAGTLEIQLNVPDTRMSNLEGGEIRLDFGLDTVNGREWIPMGVWEISAADRDAGGVLSITGIDCISKLDKECDDGTIGMIFLESGMARVTAASGVEFAQTADEIRELIPGDKNLWGTHYSATCRDEVRAIAQLIGGFAFANREGKLEFRTFGSNTDTTISADERFNVKLSENRYGVRAIAYTDKFGHTVEQHLTEGARSATLVMSNNRYIWDQESSYEKYYESFLSSIATRVAKQWTPGTIDYYGNPALDIGDMVTLTGGINGKGSTRFLICSNTWRFRGPQTLIAPGAPTMGGSTVSASEGSSGRVVAASVNITKTIVSVALTPRNGIIFDTERTAAVGCFSCKSQTNIFVECSMVLLGTESSLVTAAVYLDEAKQAISPRITLVENERATLSFTLSIMANGGNHTIKIAAQGFAELLEITAHVWGQEVVRESLKLDGIDYDFTISSSMATVTGYHGESLNPEIPEILGKGNTTIIDKKAFTDSEIESVYIPEGVTEIR